MANSYIVIVALALFYLGQTFLFESIAGMVYSILIAISFLKFDVDIHRYCEKLWFNIYTSRKHKFLLMFICIGVFVVSWVFYKVLLRTYSIKPEYLKSKCVQEKNFHYRLGLDYSFFELSKLFALIGATFGCAFATTNIEGYLSQETCSSKRITRSALGIALFSAFYNLLNLIPWDNYLTDYVFTKILPHFIGSYFVFGIYPYIWVIFGLIDLHHTETTLTSSLRSPRKYQVEEIKENSERESSDTSEYQPPKIPDKVSKSWWKILYNFTCLYGS